MISRFMIYAFTGLLLPYGHMVYGDEPAENLKNLRPLDELIEALPKVASVGIGMTQEESAFAEEISQHGELAMDRLVDLLDAKDPHVYDLVTYCIGHVEKANYKPRHFEPMCRAAARSREWLPNPIARFDTDEAAAFLAKEFRRLPQTQAQIDNALENIAPKSIAPLIEEFKNATENEDKFLKCLGSVFRDCGPKAESAVGPLTQIALDQEQPSFRRIAAIHYLGAIGPPAKASFPKLRELADREPEHYLNHVQTAIANSRTADAAEILINEAIVEARSVGDIYLFRELATGPGAKANHLSGRLVRLLDDKDPNVRLGACRTLGYMGNVEVWPDLSRMLRDQDWRVAYSAATSLAQLNAKASKLSLEACSKNHWYPRVRYAAEFALRRFNGGKVSEIDKKRLGIGIMGYALGGDDFFSFTWQDRGLYPLRDLTAFEFVEAEKALKVTRLFAPNEIHGREDLDQEIIDSMEKENPSLQLNFPELYAALMKGAPEVMEAFKKSHIFWGPPIVGFVKYEGRSIVAFYGGEDYGNVFVIEEGKPAVQVYEGFVEKVFLWNGKCVILTGLNHMGMDEGSVLRLFMEEDKWKTEFLYALPGCPTSPVGSGVLKDGRLFANCNGGAVAISPEGKFEYLGCGKPPKESIETDPFPAE